MLSFCTPARWLVTLAMSIGVLAHVNAQDRVDRDKAAAQPPNGRSLGTAMVGGIPVNLFTGAASPAYPLYELPSRSLSVPISLNYIAGNGVQVASNASEVGTGWILNAGGSVSCEVKGRPDEFDTEPKSWMTTVFNRLEGWDLEQTQHRFCEGKDTEYDIYHLVAPGLQADFVMYGPYGNGTQTDVYVLNDQTLTVQPSFWTNSRRVFSFLVTDANGTQYTFDQQERTRVQTETKQLRTGNLSSRDDYTYVAKWHLRRIRSAAGDEVNFSYEGYNGAPITYKSYSHTTLAYRDCNVSGGNCGSGTATANSYYDNRYETKTIVKPELAYKVSYIYSAVGSVWFYRELHNRRDAPGEKALDKVIVFDREDKIIKSFLFNYGYFGSSNSSPDDVRLRLDQVTARASGCQATSTTFFYREYGSVSRMASNRDYWGYYNNNQNQSMLPFVESRYDSGDRTAGGSGENCMLYKIRSGTGAYTELAYSPHVDGTGARVGGVRLQQVTIHNGVNAAQNQVFTLNYNVYYPDYGTFSSTSSAPAVPIPRLYEWQEVRYSAAAPGGWGGYGVQLDICNSSDDRIDKFLYRSSDPLSPIPADYIHYQWVTIQQPNRSRVAYQFTTAADYPDTNNSLSIKVSADPYNQNSGCYTTGGLLPAKYGGSCNGDPMAPHRAGNYLSLPQDQRPYGVVNSAAQKRGLVLRQVEADSEGRLISQVENQYSFQQVVTTPLRSLVVAKERQVFGYILYTYYYNARVYQHERSWIPLTRQTAMRYDQRRGNSGAVAAQTQVTEYEYKNYFVSKIKTYNSAGGDAQVVEYERVKDSSNPPAVLVNAKSYASPLQQQTYRLDATNTKKGTIWTSYEYQPNSSNYVRLMRTGTWDVSSGVVQYQYGVQAVEFDEYSNVLNSQAKDGLWSGTLRAHNKLYPTATVVNGKFSNGATNDSFFATAGHTSFEQDGDPDQWGIGSTLSSEAKTGQRSVQLSAANAMYGPGKTFTIEPKDQHGKYVFSCWAKVPKGEAGQSNVVMVTYLGVPDGNNTWRGTGVITNSGQDWQLCRTVLDLDDPAVRSTLPANQNVTIQCYAWISWGNGNVLVDEVRFHPETARMTTATYQPLVGKTSATDENNVTTYYVYDADNQPLLVKDAQGNILKRTKINSPAVSQELIATVAQSGGNAYPGESATFTAVASGCSSGVSYSWNFGDQSTAKGGSAQTHTYAQAGTYVLTVVAEASGFNPVEKNLSVQVVAPLVVDATYDGNVFADLCDPSDRRDVSITVHPQDGCSGYTYRWATSSYNSSTNTAGPWIDAGSSSATFNYYHSSPQQFEVRCTITDACGNISEFYDDFYTSSSSPDCY